MTGAAGGDLNGRYAVGANAAGIILRFQVALDDGHGELIFQGIDGGLKQAGLAGTRG